jgi:predicted ester cyclase
MRHTGNGLGMPPTNKSLQATGMTMIQILNGKFVTGWQNWDMLGILQQITEQPKSPIYIGANPSTKTFPS